MISMYDILRNDTRFSKIKVRIEEAGPFPALPRLPRFKHGMLLFARQPGDMIETLALEDPRVDRGSIMLFGGWLEDGRPAGVPNDGALPVPAQFVKKLIEDPRVIPWLTRPVGRFLPTLN